MSSNFVLFTNFTNSLERKERATIKTLKATLIKFKSNKNTNKI